MADKIIKKLSIKDKINYNMLSKLTLDCLARKLDVIIKKGE